MRIIGYLFVLAVVLALTGYFRGWFTVDASVSRGQANVHLGVDTERAADDAHTTLEHVGVAEPSGENAAVAGDPVVGRITAIDKTLRDLTVEISAQSTVHHVATDAVITRDGAEFSFEGLRPEMRARLTFDATQPAPTLTRIEVLP